MTQRRYRLDIYNRGVTSTTGTALDVGSGYTAFTAFSAQTIRVGRYDDELFGNILDFLIVRGLKTRQEMIALAGIA